MSKKSINDRFHWKIQKSYQKKSLKLSEFPVLLKFIMWMDLKPSHTHIMMTKELDFVQMTTEGLYLLKFPHLGCLHVINKSQQRSKVQKPGYKALPPPTGGTKRSQLDKPTTHTIDHTIICPTSCQSRRGQQWSLSIQFQFICIRLKLWG